MQFKIVSLVGVGIIYCRVLKDQQMKRLNGIRQNLDEDAIVQIVQCHHQPLALQVLNVNSFNDLLSHCQAKIDHYQHQSIRVHDKKSSNQSRLNYQLSLPYSALSCLFGGLKQYRGWSFAENSLSTINSTGQVAAHWVIKIK